MRGIGPLALLLLAACGERGGEAPEAATRQGVERSVADIRAAEAAARAPVDVSRSVGELTAKKPDAPQKAGRETEAG